MLSKNRHTQLILCLLLCFFADVKIYGIDFSNRSFSIIDLPSSTGQLNAFKKSLVEKKTGFVLRLEVDQQNNELICTLDKQRLPFSDIAHDIEASLEKDTTRIIPLFIDFNGPPSLLKDAVINSGLNHYTHYQPIGEKWGDDQEMIQKNQRLIIFTYQRIHQGNNLFHYIWNYVADFPKSVSETPYFDGFYPNGAIRNELLLVRDFISSIRELAAYNGRFFDNNQNTYFLNYMINCWKYTGKKPNLFLVPPSHIRHRDVLNKIGTYRRITGTVEYQGKPLEKVLWKHSEKTFSHGYFSFPYIEGEELNLAPFSPGYSFTPENIVITQNNIQDHLRFEARPLSLTENLLGYFPFDKHINNLVGKMPIPTNRNTHIVSDVERGNVLKLPDQSYLTLGAPENYPINGTSFTVSTWIKLNELSSQKDYCILGTQETTFRKGLHLVIRDGRPYFGFFGNDLWSDQSIKPEKWYHIVFRYNIHNGEQAIFINGKAAGASFNHASYIGESELIVGHGLKQVNFLNGYIDELCLWNRPLGIEEIQKLNAENANLDLDQTDNYLRFTIPALIISVLLIILLIWRPWKQVKRAKQDLIPHVAPKRPNSILLFGDFCILNRNGESLAQLFTPKIKELFLLILIYNTKHNRGITTERLTKMLWPDKSKQKAANNRSVSINKLRKLTEQLDGLSIFFEDGRWHIRMDEKVYCDYCKLTETVKARSLKDQHFIELFGISQRGIFLNNSDYDWLEETKGQVTNELIDLLLKFAERLDRTKEYDMLDAVVQRILLADDLNENALRFQLAILVNRDSKHLAQFTFKQFQKNYQEAYGEAYPISFEKFINHRY